MPTLSGRPQLMEIPGAELAVTVHNGAISELDQTYGALGTFVAEREIGVQGPIREHYVVSSDGASAEPVHRHAEVLHSHQLRHFSILSRCVLRILGRRHDGSTGAARPMLA